MNTLLRLVIVFAMLLGTRVLLAQRVHVSNDDPRWGEEITVTYDASDTSQWAKPDNRDTLYCATIINGVRPEHAIVHPMEHKRGAKYEATLTVPDSTNSLRVEICTPTGRVPDGITIFTCRTAQNDPTPGALIEVSTNIDSALNQELAHYPRNYAIYPNAYDAAREDEQQGLLKKSDSEWRAFRASLQNRLMQAADTTPSYYLALGSLYERGRMDSLAYLEFHLASLATRYDPIVNDFAFWNHFFAPAMTPKGIVLPREAARAITPLVRRFPRTTMAELWLERTGYDTLVSANDFRAISNEWSSSQNVDVLRSIGEAFEFKKSPLYDPEVAFMWLDRAEASNRSAAGFYSGENIYGSMGRTADILLDKARALSDLGKFDEAIATAKSAEPLAKQQYEKRTTLSTLGSIYLESGRIEDAKRSFAQALAFGTSKSVSGLEDLYAKCKENNETEDEFAARLVKQYGSNTTLPAIADFAFTTLDGMSGTLAGLRGKVVVIDCWYISCPGCELEKKSLNKLVDSFVGDTNVVFLSIALDDENSLHAYLERAESKFKIVPDGQSLCEKLGVTGYPTHIIIGRDGKTLGMEMGGNESEGDMIRTKIEEALVGKS